MEESADRRDAAPRVLWAAGGVAALVEELRTRGIYVGGLA
jgi:hypothetical protein